MFNNPGLSQALARDRSADLRRTAGADELRLADAPRLVDAPCLAGAPRSHVIHSARRRAGWLLVDVGLRLALPSRAIEHRVPARTSVTR